MAMISADSNTEGRTKNSPVIQGRVDAVENGRIFGWVWDAANPQERIVLRILVDGRRVATVVADRPRIDLRRNGIGDGAHAFDVELPREAAVSLDGLSVVAVSSVDDSEVKLKRPSVDERAAEAAIALPMSQVLDKLDRLQAAQRQIAIGQRDATALLTTTTTRLDTLASTEGELGEALSLLRGGQTDLVRHVKDLEIFLVRFDGTLKLFDDRLKALADRNRNTLKPQLLLLTALVGVVGGMLIALIAGL